MGNIPGAGGTTTSFSNTPQAKDDTYNYLEDLLKQNSTLYNSLTNTLFLDVMANDLGGNAKTLFSVEDGDGNPITTDYDLIAKDVNAAGVSAWEATRGGNWVRINNGKIEYRISDGSGVPGQGRSIDSLTAGENFADEFVYAIKLGNGTLSEATVKINITGANDVAVIGVDGSVTNDRAVTEAGGVANGNPGDPSASGKLTISDADLNQSSFQTPPSLNGTYGTFTFNAASGLWTYTLDNTRAATQGLQQGQIVTDTLTVTSLDGGTTYPITVTITGANDNPVAHADTGATSENAAVTVDVLANDTDVDDGHDGAITADEIVFATTGSDLDGLAVYDTNHDGQLSAGDEQFGEFGVWQDADGDGVLDLGEFETLTEEGIASISLTSDGHGYTAAGGDVTVVGTGSYTRADGSTGVLADAVFATRERASAEDKLNTAVASQAVFAAAAAASGVVMASAVAAKELPSSTFQDADVKATHDLPFTERVAAGADFIDQLARLGEGGHRGGEGTERAAAHDSFDDGDVSPATLSIADDGDQPTTADAHADTDAGPADSLVQAMLHDMASAPITDGLFGGPAVVAVQEGAPDLAGAPAVAAIVADAVASSQIDAVIDGILGPDIGAQFSPGLSEGGAPVFALLDMGIGDGHGAIAAGALDPLSQDMSALPDTAPLPAG